jgi:hypothetical protein
MSRFATIIVSDSEPSSQSQNIEGTLWFDSNVGKWKKMGVSGWEDADPLELPNIKLTGEITIDGNIVGDDWEGFTGNIKMESVKTLKFRKGFLIDVKPKEAIDAITS